MSYPLRLNMKQVDIVIQRKRERERKRRRCINQTQDEFPLLLLHPTRGRIPKLNAFQQMKYRYMQYEGKTIKRKQQTTAKLNLQNKKKKNIFGGAFSSVCLNVSNLWAMWGYSNRLPSFLFVLMYVHQLQGNVPNSGRSGIKRKNFHNTLARRVSKTKKKEKRKGRAVVRRNKKAFVQSIEC